MKKFKNHINLTGKVILIAEDNDGLRSLMSGIVSFGGARVIEACNGQKCLEIISGEQIDAAIIDIHMPNIDGLTAASAIRTDDKSKSIPIILVSSDHEKLAKIESESSSVEGYIYKPFSSKDMLQKVVNILSPD
ncbi:MAG: response regulator [bacterium]|nr:response regulator [bacterium]